MGKIKDYFEKKKLISELRGLHRHLEDSMMPIRIQHKFLGLIPHEKALDCNYASKTEKLKRMEDSLLELEAIYINTQRLSYDKLSQKAIEFGKKALELHEINYFPQRVFYQE